jgi:hypothetical protein
MRNAFDLFANEILKGGPELEPADQSGAARNVVLEALVGRPLVQSPSKNASIKQSKAHRQCSRLLVRDFDEKSTISEARVKPRG